MSAATRTLRRAKDYRLSRSSVKLASGLALMTLIVALSFCAPQLITLDPNAQDLTALLQRPSTDHPLGTDEAGRDLLARVLSGGQHALLVTATSAALSTVIGVGLGITAAKSRTWDAVLGRVADVNLAIPVIIIAIVVLTFLPGATWALTAVLVIGSWVLTYRLVRTEAQRIRALTFVEVAGSMDAGSLFIARTHLLPHLAPTIAVAASMNAAGIFGAVSTLGFLGLGVAPPTPDWGTMVATGQALLATNPLLSLAPGSAIVLTLVAIQLTGDGFVDTFNRAARYDGARSADNLEIPE